jgi:1-acyl-sn-glycerol-3-phosphate acyltransferase
MIEAAHAVAVPAREPARWSRSLWARALRAVLQRSTLFPLVRGFCRPLAVTGADRLPEGPVLLVANHRSHADTAVILRAVPTPRRGRIAVAAAEDHFFQHRPVGALMSLLVSAFPFPRRGREGIDRARRLIEEGWSVVLYPQGTRDGGRFRLGAGILGARGVVVVPVGIAGTDHVLPKGRFLPRRGPVSVAIGEPVRFPEGADPERVIAVLEGRVRVLHAEAGAASRDASSTTTWYTRARRLAASPGGPAVAFGWGMAEALVLPVVPDFAVATLVAAAPRRFLVIAAAAAAGSMAGGAVAYGLGSVGIEPPMLLVTERMHSTAAALLAQGRVEGLWGQPWSGIPYKAFAYQAAGHGVPLFVFLAISTLSRGFRMLAVGAAFALGGIVFRRWLQRIYPAFAMVFTVLFGLGLVRSVQAWS